MIILHKFLRFHILIFRDGIPSDTFLLIVLTYSRYKNVYCKNVRLGTKFIPS